MGIWPQTKFERDRPSRSRVMPWIPSTTRLTLRVPRATSSSHKGRGHLDSRQKGCSYPSKKTICQSDPPLQRYKLVKSVLGSCRVVPCRAVPCRAAHTQIVPRNHVRTCIARCARSLVNQSTGHVGKGGKGHVTACTQYSGMCFTNELPWGSYS